ncbi:cytochrome P450 [Lentzea sp. NBRC 105346]|uniref:cytochrome P450 n=1 Tax=Lentzea sp. NBRC 105346 TaxID=3032205 RepID=UPI0025542EC3|nr:cytochrome P450 [Lentzea sp. NBRC 105346]
MRDRVWRVTGHAEVRRLLGDDRLGRSHPDPQNAERVGESALFGGPMGDFATEHEGHARMRSLMQPHFAPKHMKTIKPRVAALTTQLLDGLTPPADLHQALALPLPVLVICELLGVPYEDRAEFRVWSEAAGNTADGKLSEQGLAELYGYGLRLVAAKRKEPGDDVISRFCAQDDVSDEEAAMLSMGLLFAGHETTVVRIGLGAMLLLTNRDQWDALCADPSLVPAAVEEILRAPKRTDNGGMIRYARTDLEVDGVTVRLGDLVLLSLESANHDPAVFPEPERFDIKRSAAAHLTFGHGPRFCLGAPLARIELTEVFTQLVTRFPAMRLAVEPAELSYRRDALTGGLTALPVTW